MSANKLSARLNYEKRIMAEYLPQFQLYRSGVNPYFNGYYTTPTNKKSFNLKVNILPWYPDEMPELYVTSPLNLYTCKGFDTINSKGISHEFHTLSNGPNGCVQICHFKTENWDASKTCIGVLFKGILWVQAYEMHLVTRKSIADILENWKRRM